MKKIILILTLFIGTCAYGIAQGKPAAPAAKSKKNTTKVDNSSNKTATNTNTGTNTNSTTRVNTKSTGVNKDGSPDMRLKVNKEAKAKQEAQQSQSTDKVVGKDAKGRTIYQGRSGGQYYINGSGNKEYIKKT